MDRATARRTELSTITWQSRAILREGAVLNRQRSADATGDCAAVSRRIASERTVDDQKFRVKSAECATTLPALPPVNVGFLSQTVVFITSNSRKVPLPVIVMRPPPSAGRRLVDQSGTAERQGEGLEHI
jgi:hypothetical protein